MELLLGDLRTKLKIIWYVIIYPIAGIMLLILLFDIYTGKIYDTATIPHQAYILVLAVVMHIMYRIMNGR
jgi:hypothetical protein